MDLQLRPDCQIFNSTEYRALLGQGINNWVLTAKGIADVPVDYELLPPVIRTVIMTEVTEHIPDLLYALPYRAVGRCVTFAMLPTPPVAPRIRSTPLALADPPVPFLVGVLPPTVQKEYAIGVNRFLKFDNPESIQGPALDRLVEKIARLGVVSRDEMVYFIIQVRALTTGAWRFIKENAVLVEIEETILRQRGTLVNPARAQALAYQLIVNENKRLS